ncbi:MAG: ParB family transcriptional regulator, chromosome partitioning protein [Candidatus Petromonas sp.]|jgi:ParB family chromosome partitioning protein|nr:ParB family transcriptional regulator, chromosome partitioning protein [Candidatus Petromonas sp.]
MSEKKLQSFEEIFGKIEEPTENTGVIELDIDTLKPFHNHPFKIYEGKRLDDMVQSIKEMGVMLPIIVRKSENETYEILSGHNRVNAARLAGLDKVPAVIKDNLTDDEAMLVVTETNLMQRSFSDMLPSERAKSLKAHHDALSQQGVRTDLINEIKNLVNADKIEDSETSSQVAKKLTSLEKVGQNYDLSKDTVARYIRLNYLIDELLKKVDDGEIAFIPAVSISYLNENEQGLVHEITNENNYKVDLKKAELLKAYSKSGKLNPETIEGILSGEIDQKKKKKKASVFKLKRELIYRFFDENQKSKEIEEIIEKALEMYFDQNKEV